MQIKIVFFSLIVLIMAILPVLSSADMSNGSAVSANRSAISIGRSAPLPSQTETLSSIREPFLMVARMNEKGAIDYFDKLLKSPGLLVKRDAAGANLLMRVDQKAGENL